MITPSTIFAKTQYEVTLLLLRQAKEAMQKFLESSDDDIREQIELEDDFRPLFKTLKRHAIYKSVYTPKFVYKKQLV